MGKFTIFTNQERRYFIVPRIRFCRYIELWLWEGKPVMKGRHRYFSKTKLTRGTAHAQRHDSPRSTKSRFGKYSSIQRNEEAPMTCLERSWAHSTYFETLRHGNQHVSRMPTLKFAFLFYPVLVVLLNRSFWTKGTLRGSHNQYVQSVPFFHFLQEIYIRLRLIIFSFTSNHLLF